MAKNSIVLLGCGDVGPVHGPMEQYTTLVRPTLAAADIRFCQVERIYSSRGALHKGAFVDHSRVPPGMASIFSDCGFDVVSLAGNHAMDWGGEGLADTKACLNERGIATVGAGKNLEEARRPAILERKGVRVAFLAYCSILNEGAAATADTPGVAPLRVHTHYEPMANQPGTQPKRIITIAHGEDLANLVFDVAEAKKKADIVVVSLHWGIHFTPQVIADYQPVVANAATRAGADLLLGHHAHVPKAVGIHNGKACFYSLSNFVMSAPEKSAAQGIAFQRRTGTTLDPDYPRLPYGVDSKRSLIARAVLSKDGVERVSFMPVLIDKQLRPEVLRNGDARFDDAVSYLEAASEGFSHKFSVDGDEVVVTAG